MNIPSSIEIYGFVVPLMVPAIVVGYLLYSFFLWRLGKKEGFDEEKIFDLFFLTAACTATLLKVNILVVSGFVFLAVLSLTQIWKWSQFRILDIFIIALYTGILLPLLVYIAISKQFSYLPVFGLGLVAVISFTRIKSTIVKSGYTFSILLMLTILVLFAYFREKPYLIFYVFLFIISLANIYLRERKSMIKPTLPVDFLNKIRNQLLHKRKRLRAEQKILMQEDPYLQSGREDGNSELMDEAILEDTHKEWNDLRRNALEKVHIQVRKALGQLKIGKYGTCEVCGKPIDKARLEAYPEATTCFDHAPNA